MNAITAILEAHGIDWRLNAQGCLEAREVWTVSGEPFEVWIVAPETTSAVYAWLGY